MLLLHPTSHQLSPLLPVRHWDHLEVGLVPHNMINKAELGARSVGGSQGGSQPGSGAPHSLRGSRVRQWGPVQLLSGISHQDTMAKSQAGPSGKYSQLGQQGVLEEGWVVPGEEQALVVELFYQGVGGVTVL